MEKEKISIIVPVYNQELRLDSCILSILEQTYSNLEIILVDDGSTDKSGEICDKYAESDERVVVIHTKNNGLSCARNTGLQHATGQYIAFVDSDDWIEPEMYSVLLEACVQNRVKISCCGRFDIDKNGNRTVGKHPEVKRIVSKEEMLSIIFRAKECDSAVWDKIYERSLWDEIRFPEGQYYEDVAVMYRIIDNVDKVVLISTPFYNYVHHGEGITASKSLKYAMDFCYHSYQLVSMVSKKYPSLKSSARTIRIYALSFYLKRYSYQTKAIKKLYKQQAKEYRKELLCSCNEWMISDAFSLKQKISLALKF